MNYIFATSFQESCLIIQERSPHLDLLDCLAIRKRLKAVIVIGKLPLIMETNVVRVLMEDLTRDSEATGIIRITKHLHRSKS